MIFIDMVNEQFREEWEYKQAFAEGERMVEKARQHRAEFRLALAQKRAEQRREQIIHIIEALGLTAVFAVMFVISGLLVLAT